MEIQSTLNQKWLEFTGVGTIECVGFSDLLRRGLLGDFDIVGQWLPQDLRFDSEWD